MMHSLSPVPRTMASYSSFMLSQLYQGFPRRVAGGNGARRLDLGLQEHEHLATDRMFRKSTCNCTMWKAVQAFSTARHHEPECALLTNQLGCLLALMPSHGIT